MNDSQIIELFFERNEKALSETKEKYNTYCKTIAHNLLENTLDEEECINDAYIKLWNNIPPNRPENLGAYLGKIVRNTAIDRIKSNSTLKRKVHNVSLALSELNECIPDTQNEHFDDRLVLKEALNSFLTSLSYEKRKIFIERYWYVYTIEDIAKKNNISESKVKSILFRTRKKLRDFLIKEDITI